MRYLLDFTDDFISLLFPKVCYGCGEHLLRNEHLICTGCFVTIARTDFHLTEDNPVSRLFWGRCRVEKSAVFSYYTKGSRIRKIIHALKYDGIRELGTLMGRIYAGQLAENRFFEDIEVIIPVPLHPSRLQKRGYNQCEYICKGISEISGLPVDKSSLVRLSSSVTQTGRARYDRWLNVEGIFGINDFEALKGKHVLLVDDVITTGSTIEACVNELLGIENVRVSVIALAWTVM